ncbi:MAG: hypothetical protein MZU84_08685 [Sphingobacterium sp.]|nr:hypothetical protein [Sphingobacterium sp.]
MDRPSGGIVEAGMIVSLRKACQGRAISSSARSKPRPVPADRRDPPARGARPSAPPCDGARGPRPADFPPPARLPGSTAGRSDC